MASDPNSCFGESSTQLPKAMMVLLKECFCIKIVYSIVTRPLRRCFIVSVVSSLIVQ